MISIAQSKSITREFEIAGRFYAFDSTTIDLCMSLFGGLAFARQKVVIKIHTLYDVVSQIPTLIHNTEANAHGMNAIDVIPYKPNVYYIFDRGYFDLLLNRSTFDLLRILNISLFYKSPIRELFEIT